MRYGVGCQPADFKLTGVLIRESVADGPAIDLPGAGRRRILRGLVCRASGDGVGLAQRRGLRLADYPVQGDSIGRGHGGYEAVVESDASLPKRTAVPGGAGTNIVPVAAGGRAGVACCPSLGVGSASSAVFSSRSRPGG